MHLRRLHAADEIAAPVSRRVRVRDAVDREAKIGCRARLAAPVDERLFFAGEACSTGDFSTAHGGWLTGVAAAEQVIAARKQKR